MNKGIIEVDGKFYQKCKVVMLPTKDRSKVGVNPSRLSKNKLYYFDPVVHGEAQHLYILSNEEIKEGDWCMCDDRNHTSEAPIYFVGQCKSITNGWINVIEGQGENPNWTKKIIATTDPELTRTNDKLEAMRMDTWNIPNNLLRPSDAFLKVYCEKGGIDEVLVEYEMWAHTELDPQYKLKVAPDNTITIKPVKSSWSREEIQNLFYKFNKEAMLLAGCACDVLTEKSLNIWLEENL